MTTAVQHDELELVVRSVHQECVGVRSIELHDLCGGPLPEWRAGSHIDLVLPSGKVRSYSLCSDPDDRASYRIAVLREDDGRGGSVELHEADLVGQQVRASRPRNDFEVLPAQRYLFIAGGIGITPLLPMIREVRAQGRPWHLYYLGKQRRSMAFLDDLLALRGDVEVVARDERERLDLRQVIEAEPPGTEVYCCGPNGLMDAVDETTTRTGHRLHLERFGRPDLPERVAGSPSAASDGSAIGGAIDPDGPFEVELARSGDVITVGPDQTILGCLRNIRQGLNFSCTDGYCGTCETAVIAGTPDHRDTVLNDAERAENATMMVCVGRSKTARLVLDI